MKRNFGSLNLAALAVEETSVEDTLVDGLVISTISSPALSSVMTTMEDYPDAIGDDDGCVGWPLDQEVPRRCTPAASGRSSPAPIQHATTTSETTVASSSVDSSGLIHHQSSMITAGLTPTSAADVLHFQPEQQAEMHTLRCLNLKMMLSTISPSPSNPIESKSASPSYGYPPVVSERAKAALLPIRRASLQRNMIQSV